MSTLSTWLSASGSDAHWVAESYQGCRASVCLSVCLCVYVGGGRGGTQCVCVGGVTGPQRNWRLRWAVYGNKTKNISEECCMYKNMTFNFENK